LKIARGNKTVTVAEMLGELFADGHALFLAGTGTSAAITASFKPTLISAITRLAFENNSSGIFRSTANDIVGRNSLFAGALELALCNGWLFLSCAFCDPFAALCDCWRFHICPLASPELIRNRTVGAIFGLTIGFGMAFGFGIDAARFELWIELPLNKITIGEKGKDAETDVTAQIIRSGERGVLYYDPKLGQFGLVPWDSIKRIAWARSPLIGKTL